MSSENWINTGKNHEEFQEIGNVSNSTVKSTGDMVAEITSGDPIQEFLNENDRGTVDIEDIIEVAQKDNLWLLVECLEKYREGKYFLEYEDALYFFVDGKIRSISREHYYKHNDSNIESYSSISTSELPNGIQKFPEIFFDLLD